ncbi:MAG TPA: hypothetical protein ENH02_00900 [Bacteroidetes bacterium]|nr:hypothetical protein [Bacteroidota bacterium]
MTGRNLKIGILLIAVFSLLQGCSIKKYLGKDDYLIRKYNVKVENKPAGIDISDLRTFFKPRPNKKFLGIYFKLNAYYKAQKKQSKFNKWRNKNFGEYPVIYDEGDASRIAFKMEKYLDNVGFFKSSVTYDVEYNKKTLKLNYTVKPGTPYHISKITYEIPDTLIRHFFNNNLDATLIKKADIYNAYTFDDERDRITKDLRDEGYYFFNRNYIQFIVDSSFLNHSMKVTLRINNIKVPVEGKPGKFTEINHKRYFIDHVTVIPDFKPNDSLAFDTVLHNIRFWNDSKKYTYIFLLDKKRRLKPKAFNTAIKIKPGMPYSASSVQMTYRHLFNYSIIRTANISFDTTGTGKKESGNHYNLNSRIQMQTAKVNSIQLEAIGTNSSGDLGIRGNVIYSNRNIFKKGEVFSINFKGGFEAQTAPAITEQGSGKLFNTFEAGINGNIYFPWFFFPGRLNKFNQHYNPVTNLNFGYSYQNRPYYSRNITSLSLGYSWQQNKEIRHIVSPVTINYVNITPTPEFDSILENEPNPRIREQYSDHMILGLNYSFIFNNQNLKYLNHFNYFRLDFESSGNLLYALNTLFNSPKTPGGYYEFTGVRYAQYLRANLDYRHYFYFANKTNSLVFRFLLGAAIPYLNSTEITFEKGFYAGGANDMRGWKFRTLGPGGYQGKGDYERIGEIQIEGNIEYRFPIYNILKGAFFTDIGNIWNMRESATYPEGTFYWDTWYRQLAMDMGFGLRLDFNFFVFRVDAAIPVRNPAYPQDERWRFNYLQFGGFVFNFGIGYPF